MKNFILTIFVLALCFDSTTQAQEDCRNDEYLVEDGKGNSQCVLEKDLSLFIDKGWLVGHEIIPVRGDTVSRTPSVSGESNSPIDYRSNKKVRQTQVPILSEPAFQFRQKLSPRNQKARLSVDLSLERQSSLSGLLGSETRMGSLAASHPVRPRLSGDIASASTLSGTYFRSVPGIELSYVPDQAVLEFLSNQSEKELLSSIRNYLDNRLEFKQQLLDVAHNVFESVSDSEMEVRLRDAIVKETGSIFKAKILRSIPLMSNIAAIADAISSEYERAANAFLDAGSRDFYNGNKLLHAEASLFLTTKMEEFEMEIQDLPVARRRDILLSLALATRPDQNIDSPEKSLVRIFESYLGNSGHLEIYVDDDFKVTNAVIVGPHGEKIADAIRAHCPGRNDLFDGTRLETLVYQYKTDNLTKSFPNGLVKVNGNTFTSVDHFGSSYSLEKKLFRSGVPLFDPMLLKGKSD